MSVSAFISTSQKPNLVTCLCIFQFFFPNPPEPSGSASVFPRPSSPPPASLRAQLQREREGGRDFNELFDRLAEDAPAATSSTEEVRLPFRGQATSRMTSVWGCRGVSPSWKCFPPIPHVLCFCVVCLLVKKGSNPFFF